MKLWTLILLIIVAGCQKTEFNPPVLEPEFDSNLVFNNGEEVELQAGIQGYHLYTDSYISNQKKVYRSRMTSDINCEQNCSSDVTLEIHQGNITGTLEDISFEQLQLLNKVKQDVRHEFKVKKDQVGSLFDHIWKVGSSSPSIAPDILLNQEFGQGNQSVVNLIFRSQENAIVKFEHTYSPLEHDNQSIQINLSKEDSKIEVSVSQEGISKVIWKEDTTFNMQFDESISEGFQIITEEGNIIKGTIIIPEGHSSFSSMSLGYEYLNEISPDIDTQLLENIEIIYRDNNGTVFRSSLIDQILPNSVEITNVESYINNENGIPTTRCQILVSCLLFSNQTKEVRYMKSGSFKIAFVDD